MRKYMIRGTLYYLLLFTRQPVRGVFCECSEAKVTENPRVAARYDAECIISVHREACYWSLCVRMFYHFQSDSFKKHMSVRTTDTYSVVFFDQTVKIAFSHQLMFRQCT